MRRGQGTYIMRRGELGSVMPIKQSMRGNTAAIYQHNESNTRKGAKSCPVQKQRHMVRQIKYVSAENKVYDH